MTIYSGKIDKSTAELVLEGRLDTGNAPLLERKISQWGDEVTTLILDFSKLEYISSMGLRILLHTEKKMKERNGRLEIKNISPSVREVFEITGFLNLMVEEEKFIIIRKDAEDNIRLSLSGKIETDNIASVSEELSNIKEQKLHKPVTVILDMEKLRFISSNAVTQLNQAITNTAWANRTLQIQNASPDIQAALKEFEMKN